MNLRFMDRDAEGIEFAINVLATQKRLFLLLRTRFARSGEFATHGVEYDNSTLYRFKRSLRLAIQNTNDCSWPGFKATW